ncbi:DENN domain containing 6B, transcript variant X2 [Ictidomys tridecemlineatus]|uniref:protein DENND6B isoform X2 n=1 Tax=Ictidomys tridecemlineatus TaxID=43179 RepID=UPI000B546936|nr:protein DENND6B isoform X2 [Ictidomys tridecemlineatus]KAG3290669.1 DENN domain containing 6B, transcript variant X2 [Ictidomys tridecemlineatus]
MEARAGAGPRRAGGVLGAAGPSSANRATRTPAAPWARFSAWLECVCVVTFDLELGQALELVYPSDFQLTDKEKSSICYLSFPDSHSGCLGDTQFSFRMRQCGGQRSPWHADDRPYNGGAPVALQREPAHYLGYVYFRQVKDSSVRRGYFQKVHIPSRVDKLESKPPKPCDQENLLPAPVVLSSVHELDLFRCFQPVLTHVQMLWELMLLGEPLVVLAPSPDVSSEMVLALTSCLQPLKFCCDFRPYFTIHDSEFKELTTRTQAPPNVVLGVTNPFFIKTLQHWPHVLRIGEPKMSGDLPKQVKLKKPSRLKTVDTKPGLYTSYTAHLHRDKALLKRLLKGVQKKRPWDMQSALLRRHLLELTQSFIIPLEHYMASLMPLQKSITPWKTPPQIRPFHQEDFLQSLEHAGPQLTCILKGDWLGLYRRFFKSPHFDGWYRQRHKEMAQRLEALHLEAICEANIETWMQDKSEVEVVDLVLKLREKLVRAQSHQLPVKEVTLQRAQLYIETVMGSLPKDLQAVLCPP